MAAEPRSQRRALVAARVGFGAVVLAATVSGLALLVFPESTGDFFSWGLGPPPLASLIGGLYLASAVVFAVAIRLPPADVRSLLAASVVLTLPTLAATFIHLEIFDFGLWQARAWVALFAAAPPFWAGILWADQGAAWDDEQVSGATNAASAVLAVVLAGWAILLFVDPDAAVRPVPFRIDGLGGRFVGAWLGFMATMAAWFALRPRQRLLPALALALYPTGAGVAALRSFEDLTSGKWIYLGALVMLTAGFAVAAGRQVRSGFKQVFS